METVASRYGDSLFSLAKEENKITEYSEQMEMLNQIFQDNPSYIHFFNHAAIEGIEKEKVIDTVFAGQIESYICNFLKLIIKKHRILYISDIIKHFIDLCDEEQGILKGTIYTPFPLSKQQVKEVEESLSKKENKKVILNVEEDSSLIGGMKIAIKNRIIDGSIRNQMEILKQGLLRK